MTRPWRGPREGVPLLLSPTRTRSVTSAASLALILLLLPAAIPAQEAMTITGRVTDETAEPIATVNVYIDGTDLATLTDSEGS